MNSVHETPVQHGVIAQGMFDNATADDWEALSQAERLEALGEV